MTSTIFGALNGDIATALMAGMTITSGLSVYTTDQYFNYRETKNMPIAYIYDLIKKSKKL